jgi:glutathione synthase
MSFSVAVLMDPIGAIKIAKDSTFAMLLEAQRRGHQLFYMEQGDLALRDGSPWARLAPLTVKDDPGGWFSLGKARWRDLRELDVVLMRKDPPVDQQFLYDTMVLEAAQRHGVQVINDPRALRDCNEKVFALHFPQCMAPTLVARDPVELRRFVDEHGEAVLKPLDGMGGRGIFRVRSGDSNLNSMLETLLGGDSHGQGRQFAVAQKFIPQISAGRQARAAGGRRTGALRAGADSPGQRVSRQPRRRRARRRRAALRSRSLDRRRGGAGTGPPRPAFRGPGRDRRLPDRDQRHIPDLHPGAGCPVRA